MTFAARDELTVVALRCGEQVVAIKPVLQALLLADHVYVDHATGKRIIVGVFDFLKTPEFPTQFQRTTFAYCAFTGIRGKIDVIFRYVDLESNEVLMETIPIEVRAEDPITTSDLVTEIPPLPMPHPGVYALEVHSCDELIGSLRVTVVGPEAQGDNNDDNGRENGPAS